LSVDRSAGGRWSWSRWAARCHSRTDKCSRNTRA
jgi:hypothetical protein